MKEFKNFIIESKTITVDVSKLENYPKKHMGDDLDDLYYFMEEMEGYGLKEKDWHYDGNYNMVMPSKFKKYLKPWNVSIK